MKKTALITGIAGFAGSHLAEYLLAQGDIAVCGVTRPGWPTINIEPIRGQLALFDGDLLDAKFVNGLIKEAQPTHIFHLAGQASIPLSWEQPQQTFADNVVAQLNLLQALVILKPDAAFLAVGSRDEYGIVKDGELPINESQPFRPNSPYSVSKIAQDMLAYQYFLTHQLPVVRVRPFNHIGPRQGDGFVASSFARQIAEAEKGLREPIIKVGNLKPRRDFTDVRDMMRAYWLALAKGTPGEVYNIGCGRSISIGEMLDILVRHSTVSVRLEQEEERLRRADVDEVLCDSAKFRRETGWEPEIPIETTLRDTLDYWRAQLGASANVATKNGPQ